jgi:hypothetical protein
MELISALITFLRKLGRFLSLPAILILGASTSEDSGTSKDVPDKNTSADGTEKGAMKGNAADKTTSSTRDNLLTFHQNYDNSYKFCVNAYPSDFSKSIHLETPVLSSLNTELPRADVGKDIADSFHLLGDKDGNPTKNVLYGEMETHLDANDVRRFIITSLTFDSFHDGDGLRVSNIVIFTKEITKNAQLLLDAYSNTFNIQTFNLSKISAEEKLDQADKDVLEGKEVNLFDMLFAASCHSDETPTEVLRRACKIIIKCNKDIEWKNIVITQLILAANKVVPMEDLLAIRKEMRDMGASIADVFIEEVRVETLHEVAVTCIQEGWEDSLVSKISKLPLAEVAEIRAEVEAALVKARREAAAACIKEGLEDSLVSERFQLPIEEVAIIRAEVKAASSKAK